MLQGATETLKSESVDYVFISTHSQDLHDTVIAKLKELSLRVEVSSRFDIGTTSFDGFIFASRATLSPVFPEFKPIDLCDILNAGPDEYISFLQKTYAGCRH